MIKPISVFISYAHEDTPYLEELQKYLQPYVKKQTISIWTDRDIIAGQKWDELIKTKLKESEVVLFLVSQDFLVSDYINNIEIKSAIENNKLIIIPIIIRPIEMSQLELKCFQVVPSGAEPVVKWANRDEAWVDVLKELKIVFDKINGHYIDQQGNITISNHSNILNTVNASDKLVKGFIVLLILLGFILFGVGLILNFNNDTIDTSRFFIVVSFALMGFGFGGYFLGRKLLSF